MNEEVILNGDRLAQLEFKKLIELFNIDCVIETGTYKGSTTKFLAEQGLIIHSIELNEEHYLDAKKRLKDLTNVVLHHGSSEEVLKTLLPELRRVHERILIYLDAHWNPSHHPLMNELRFISEYYHDQAIIVIDDFKVPNRNYSYDTYAYPIKIENVQPGINKCYSEFIQYYNGDADMAEPVKNLKPAGKSYFIPKNFLGEVSEEDLFKTVNGINNSIITR